jgi:hypothetical protein
MTQPGIDAASADPSHPDESPKGKRTAWYESLWEPTVEKLKDVATAMLAGSVALFQWFLAKFFETVSSTDSLGLPFDRLLLLFLACYLTLPFLFISHLAASDTQMRWTRLTSYVGLVLLGSLLAARILGSWSAIIALGGGTILIVRAQYRSLDDSRASKANGTEQTKGSTVSRATFYHKGPTRSGLAVLYAAIAIVSLVSLSIVLPPNRAERFFGPCNARDSIVVVGGADSGRTGAADGGGASALCVYVQLRDTLARREIAPDVRRAVALLERDDALFRRARFLGWTAEIDSAAFVAMMEGRALPIRRSQLWAACDSMRAISRLLHVDAAEHLRRAATGPNPPLADRLARQLRVPGTVPDSISRGIAVADTVLRRCNRALVAADTATREATAWTARRAELYTAWLRMEWSRQINQVRQVLVGAYVLALLLLGAWIATTQVYTRSRIQRQLGTLVATMLFFVPLLPGVRPEDVPLGDPARLFDFPQWKATATVVASEPGRPTERTVPTPPTLAADSGLLAAMRKQDSTIGVMRQQLDTLGGRLSRADTVVREMLRRLR